jgi:hypothetical protein
LHNYDCRYNNNNNNNNNNIIKGQKYLGMSGNNSVDFLGKKFVSTRNNPEKCLCTPACSIEIFSFSALKF